MIINPSNALHTTVDHSKAGTPPEIRRQHESVMADLAKQAGQTWDGGTPLPTPLPANPYSRQK